ncbi:hypothetical protein [Micromonospora globbae]
MPSGRKAAGQEGWANIMARKRRKTLVLCGTCHGAVHASATTA